jgi:Putative zinc-finger
MTFARPHIAAISCQQTTVLVSLQRDHDIQPEQTRQLTHHIAHCKPCQVASEQFSHLFVALDTLLERAPP